MSIATVVTRGFGSFGSVNLVVTRGYSVGVASVGAGRACRPTGYQQGAQCLAGFNQGAQLSAAYGQGMMGPVGFGQGSADPQGYTQGAM